MGNGDTHPLIALCYASGSDSRRFPELMQAIYEAAQCSPRAAGGLLDSLEPHLQQAATISAQMPNGWNERLAASLQAIFGFSKTELQIIAALLEGASLADIAVQRHRSLHTLRTQLKRLLARTPCRTQAELILLVRGLALVSAQEHAGTAVAGEVIRTELADGSHICHFEYGATDGYPVLLLHTALLGPELPPTVTAAAKKFGLRILALARPGYAGSSAPPPADHDLSMVSRRIADWLERRGLGPLPVLGNVVGAIYAHALARECPDLLTRVFTCAGPVPLTPANYEALPISRRVWAQLVRRQPGLLLPFARLGVGYVRSGHARRSLQTAYRAQAADAAALEDNSLVEGLCPAVSSAAAAGAERFVEAVTLQCRDWQSLSRHAVPVTAIHGAADDIVDISDVRGFYPDKPVVAVPNAGQLLLYARPEAVFAEISQEG
nr:alpha/beta hydrolase [Oceanococcus sp. HetDA_MAG_MS8]